MMVTLLLYAYGSGVFSSRMIQARCEERGQGWRWGLMMSRPSRYWFATLQG
jgi:transposase